MNIPLNEHSMGGMVLRIRYIDGGVGPFSGTYGNIMTDIL